MKQNKNSADRIPLILTYNFTLPNMKDFLARNWNILSINQGFQDIFNELQLLAYRKNKNPQDLLGRKNIAKGKLIWTNNKSKKTGYSSPCQTKSGNLCCKQVNQTTTFTSSVTMQKFNIYKLNCKIKYLIYVIECTPYNKQYIRKSETDFPTK